MKRTAMHTVAASLLLSGASLIYAQAQPQPPSRLLRIFREDIKSGKGAAHEKAEAAYVRAFSKSDYPSYLALENMTGTSQAWFIERYDSYEAMGKAIQLAESEPLKTALEGLDAQDGEYRTSDRAIIATYQPDLSYVPGSPLGSKARYYTINVIRVRPGHTAEFTEMRKQINAAYAKTGRTQRRVVYLVNSGMPSGTYLVLAAMDSLHALDPTPGMMSMNDAFGPDTLARLNKTQADIEISSESTLFSINPRMSNPPKDYLTADPGFWAPKPKPAGAKAATTPKPAGQ